MGCHRSDLVDCRERRRVGWWLGGAISRNKGTDDRPLCGTGNRVMLWGVLVLRSTNATTRLPLMDCLMPHSAPLAAEGMMQVNTAEQTVLFT